MEAAALLHGMNPVLLDIALLIGRVGIGLCFIVHALGKLGIVGSGTISLDALVF